MKTKFLKILITIVLFALIIIALVGMHLFYKISSSLFVLSSNQVHSIFDSKTKSCEKISDCELLPGDILVRRQITQRTWILDKAIHPYFTHAAFYLGNNQIIEAKGTEKDPKDDIQVSLLSSSNWFDLQIESWVIIRPKRIGSKFDALKNNLVEIANDPDYTFGLPKENYKRTTCADLIFRPMHDLKIITIYNPPNIITPDYLVWATMQTSDFEVVGYN